VNDATAILVGASISAVVAIVAVAVQHALARRALLAEQRSARLAACLAAAQDLNVAIGRVARLAPGVKAEAYDLVVTTVSTRFNERLAAVLLLDNDKVVQSAFAVDQALMELTRLCFAKAWGPEEWRAQRRVVSDLTHAFQIEARRALGSRALAHSPRMITAGPDHAIDPVHVEGQCSP
jgi:hypothetical protein